VAVPARRQPPGRLDWPAPGIRSLPPVIPVMPAQLHAGAQFDKPSTLSVHDPGGAFLGRRSKRGSRAVPELCIPAPCLFHRSFIIQNLLGLLFFCSLFFLSLVNCVLPGKRTGWNLTPPPPRIGTRKTTGAVPDFFCPSLSLSLSLGPTVDHHSLWSIVSCRSFFWRLSDAPRDL
jgi:hypothetical protein